MKEFNVQRLRSNKLELFRHMGRQMGASLIEAKEV